MNNFYQLTCEKEIEWSFEDMGKLVIFFSLKNGNETNGNNPKGNKEIDNIRERKQGKVPKAREVEFKRLNNLPVKHFLPFNYKGEIKQESVDTSDKKCYWSQRTQTKTQ